MDGVVNFRSVFSVMLLDYIFTSGMRCSKAADIPDISIDNNLGIVVVSVTRYFHPREGLASHHR
jgi:hypothetical protein